MFIFKRFIEFFPRTKLREIPRTFGLRQLRRKEATATPWTSASRCQPCSIGTGPRTTSSQRPRSCPIVEIVVSCCPSVYQGHYSCATGHVLLELCQMFYFFSFIWRFLVYINCKYLLNYSHETWKQDVRSTS